jgi:hypothetical protein
MIVIHAAVIFSEVCSIAEWLTWSSAALQVRPMGGVRISADQSQLLLLACMKQPMRIVR